MKDCIERIKKISNSWEPELCRHCLNKDERVCMEIYHVGDMAPERHRMTLDRAAEYISDMATVMDIKSMLSDLDHITIRSLRDSRLIYRLTARYGYAEEEFKAV